MSALMSGLFLEHSSHLRDHSYKSRITKPKHLQSCIEHPSQAVYGFSHKYVESLLKSPWPVPSLFFFLLPLFTQYSVDSISWHTVALHHPCTIPSFSVCSHLSHTRRLFWHAVPSSLAAKTHSACLTPFAWLSQ